MRMRRVPDTFLRGGAHETPWKERPVTDGVLDDAQNARCALERARRLGELAASVGFDWPSLAGVLAKVDEERRELDVAIAEGDPDAIAGEIGDVFFSVVNICRHLGVDPEAALEQTNAKFERRFRAIEAGLRADGRRFGDESLDALEARWQAAKID